ncbi:MAG: hypothetical protein L6R36_007730 [Xanthoria steineri]|nr:MAG: hypothetical protein L6R36_007730 [Xanthoria steineri]
MHVPYSATPITHDTTALPPPLTMTKILPTLLLALTTLLPFTFAQFQFFEQMFQGGHQHQQQQPQAQNVASDSEWYQQTYESGSIHPLSPFPCPYLTPCLTYTTLANQKT